MTSHGPLTLEPVARPESAAPQKELLPRAVFWIIGIGLAARLALLPFFEGIGPGSFDAKEYNALAINLVERGEFALHPGEPTSLRPPLYPMMLAAIYSVAGNESFMAIYFLQSILSALTALFVYWLGREVYDRSVGVVAAAIYVGYPSLWAHSYMVLTEVPFTFLLCLSLVFLTRFLRRDALTDLALGGALLALAGLMRTAMSLFPGPFLIVLLCARHLSWRRRLIAGVVFVAAFSVTTAPWVIRNTALQGKLTWIDSQGGRILRWSLDEGKVAEAARTSPGEAAHTEAEHDRQAMRNAFHYMLERPDVLVEHMTTNFFNFWRLDREVVAAARDGLFGNVPGAVLIPLGLLTCGYYALTLLAGIFGVTLFPPRAKLAGAVLLFVIGHVCLVHSVVYGHSRYHLVIMPLVMVFSAALLVNRRSIFEPALRKRLLAPALVSVVLMTAWIIQLIEHDLKPVLRAIGVL